MQFALQCLHYESIATASKQYNIKDKASTIVVINGDATTAGSNLTFFAKRGSEQPTNLAITTVKAKARETIKLLNAVYPSYPNSKLSININLPKQAMPSVTPINIETLISFHITLKTSFVDNSFNASERITVTDA